MRVPGWVLVSLFGLVVAVTSAQEAAAGDGSHEVTPEVTPAIPTSEEISEEKSVQKSDEYDDYMDYAEFVERDLDEESYDREITLVVPKGAIKTDFYVEMEVGNKLELSCQMLTVQENNGRPIAATVTIKDSENRVLVTKSDREGKVIDLEYKVARTDTFQIMFHVMDYYTDNKMLWVEFTIEGKMDPKEIDKKFRLKRENQYKEIHDSLIKSMKGVQKNQMSAIRYQMMRVHAHKRGMSRLQALSGMIDKWSIIHVFVVLVVMVAQVLILKKFFELPSDCKSRI